MSPRTNSHPGGETVLSPRENTRELLGEIAMLRAELGGLVAELDRRRHEFMDIKGQAKRHAVGATLTGVTLLASAAGFVWLGTWRAQRRRKIASRIERWRDAVPLLLAHPERAAPEHGTVAKILTSAATAAVAAAIKNVLERGLRYALHPEGPLREGAHMRSLGVRTLVSAPYHGMRETARAWRAGQRTR